MEIKVISNKIKYKKKYFLINLFEKIKIYKLKPIGSLRTGLGAKI